MAGPSSGHRADDRQESVGDLVALAASDIAQLVKCELDLAKMELKEDARQVGVGGAMLAIAVFISFMVVVMLCFALAYGLVAAGVWDWLAFLIVAVIWALLGAGAVLIVRRKFTSLSGLRKTRGTVSGGIAMLRSDSGEPGDNQARKAGDG